VDPVFCLLNFNQVPFFKYIAAILSLIGYNHVSKALRYRPFRHIPTPSCILFLPLFLNFKCFFHIRERQNNHISPESFDVIKDQVVPPFNVNSDYIQLVGRCQVERKDEDEQPETTVDTVVLYEISTVEARLHHLLHDDV
jgi:hypothetical protein